MSIQLTIEQAESIIARVRDTAVYYNEPMTDVRLEQYMKRLLQCPRLTSYERILKAFDMADWQMRTFPLVADLNNMFSK
jgi:hypothetical protein